MGRKNGEKNRVGVPGQERVLIVKPHNVNASNQINVLQVFANNSLGLNSKLIVVEVDRINERTAVGVKVGRGPASNPVGVQALAENSTVSRGAGSVYLVAYQQVGLHVVDHRAQPAFFGSWRIVGSGTKRGKGPEISQVVGHNSQVFTSLCRERNSIQTKYKKCGKPKHPLKVRLFWASPQCCLKVK